MTNKCISCHYEWEPHEGKIPKCCPKCKTYHWSAKNAPQRAIEAPTEQEKERSTITYG